MALIVYDKPMKGFIRSATSLFLPVLVAVSCGGGRSSSGHLEVEQLAEKYLIHLLSHEYEEARALSSDTNKEDLYTLEKIYTIQQTPTIIETSEKEIEEIRKEFRAIESEIIKELELEDFSEEKKDLKGAEVKVVAEEYEQTKPGPTPSLRIKATSSEVKEEQATVLVDVTQEGETKTHKVTLVRKKEQWLVNSDVTQLN